MASLTIRNLDDTLINALKRKAGASARSVEAELRIALKAWADQPAMMQIEAVSQRLQQAIALAENGRVSDFSTRPPYSAARLADAIGEDQVTLVAQWIEGIAEPSLSQLKAIANYCSVSPDWLVYGEGTPYLCEYDRIPENAGQGALWLLDADPTTLKTHLQGLRFIRCAGERGGLLLVKQWADKDLVIRTPYVVSDDTGGGGRSSLRNLTQVWHLLYRIYGECNLAPDIVITSHIVSERTYRQLQDGWHNPSALIHGLPSQPWWEDIWDSNQFARSNYWPGWNKLCAGLYEEVSDSNREANIRELIESGEHPLLKEIENAALLAGC
ncbi:FitA-like ribbon-helix-helix domain-containing protein [Acetobacter indonesiensis]|uniref:FitA-like ribbon-helix-helix domain-containing protein n=1 Tax=Acetobacter indonesiensis TaxID=104101 RepID=UPI0020A363FC|nr:helix-turn-helix domain-containing protein [Acetobacter indonesiensis]